MAAAPAAPAPGMDPDEGVIGFDCSGLTQYAYAQAGISIPRNSRAQYAALPKVSSDDLQAGDLVFWGSDASDPGSIDHVAIYLGGDQVVQAPQSGDVVKVSPMWWRQLRGGRAPQRLRRNPACRDRPRNKGVGQPRGELPDASIRLAAGSAAAGRGVDARASSGVGPRHGAARTHMRLRRASIPSRIV